ncbi:hypothetical protein [Cellulomonas sp. NS3]|uniref:hypothetical protein n=1 Tax=Cellulomonas sp. NS3 TaxID=2973977 RepID=UPI0021620A51|nr:hypothetical protein [Cellulomonas sp. NS3]
MSSRTSAGAPRRGTWRPSRDAGQGTLEYLGIVCLAAVLVLGVVAAVAAANPRFHSTLRSALCTISTFGGGDCTLPAPDGEEDRDDPWHCSWFGIGCEDTGSDDEGGSSDDEGDSADEGGDDEDQPWHCDWFGIGCDDDGTQGEDEDEEETEDSGADEPSDGTYVVDGVTIPEGLIPSSETVQTLLATERGRQTLQWLADHGIPVVFDSVAGGAWWDGTSVTLGTGYDDPVQAALTILHEANHARYDREGRSVGDDIGDLPRDEYVGGMLDEETDGVVQEVLGARELRDTGTEVPVSAAESRYGAAYDAAIAAGRSRAQAEDAGFAAVREMFTDGTFVTSTTGESYEDYYGDSWEDNN